MSRRSSWKATTTDYWDRILYTDKTVHFNRPDITLVDKTNKQAEFIDIAIPLTQIYKKQLQKKKHKYQDLAFEIKQQWQVNEIIVIPHVLSAMGVISNMLNPTLTALNLPPRLLSQVQQWLY
jgi:hypothetical protein